jgi:NADPH-dependent 2,4-dienoyl-CoA reductase/sulfur reductase-like enzyme
MVRLQKFHEMRRNGEPRTSGPVKGGESPPYGDVPPPSVIVVTTMPTRLLIVGGGPVGLFLALKVGRLGIDVTVAEAEPTIIPSPRAIGYELRWRN